MPEKVIKPRSKKAPGKKKKSKAREHVASVLAWAIFFLGILNIFAWVLPASARGIAQLTSPIIPSAFAEAAGFLHILFGIILIFLAHQLYQRKRGAWTLILFLLIFSLIASILGGTPTDVVTGAVSIILIIYLLLERDMFTHPSVFMCSC
jgi:lysylphosphatidylglycerol synthetase-like protein (DUF2156 family)